MTKELTIRVNNKTDLFKAYLAAINWTFANPLTESEIEVLAILMYYNDFYKEIKDNQVRSDLILSSSTKKKIKEEFDIPSQKLETYLGKLRKKEIIGNSLDSKFMVYPDGIFSIKYNFMVQGDSQNNIQSVMTQQPIVQQNTMVQPVKQEPVVQPVKDEYLPPTYHGETPITQQPLNSGESWLEGMYE